MRCYRCMARSWRGSPRPERRGFSSTSPPSRSTARRRSSRPTAGPIASSPSAHRNSSCSSRRISRGSRTAWPLRGSCPWPVCTSTSCGRRGSSIRCSRRGPKVGCFRWAWSTAVTCGADLAAALGLLERARERIGADELWVAPSCSLLHVPVDLDLERRLDPDLKGWLAFAKQKLAEVVTLTRAVRDGRQAVAAELEANARAIAARRSSRRIHDPYVKQRLIYGDVSRPKPMTVRWSTYAQSRTAKPVKGMLTGPVTILQWSFVRDDQPRAETAKQLALAIRDEVKDLEAAGIRVIQI